jgi:tetratricopeptide (TPR) repeat protein
MSVLAGFLQLHKLAEKYVERGLAVAQEVNQIANRVTVNVVTSAYLLTVGQWEVVRSRVEEARALCERIGDYRQWGDCMGMLGESAFISGDLAYSMRIQKVVLADARRRRSPLHQCWGLLGVAVNNIRLGNEAEAIPMLEEALKILEETPNLSSSIETNGQLALAYFLNGQEDKALAYATLALEIAGGVSPTVYSMDVGYAGIADVFFGVWERSLRSSASSREVLRLKYFAEKSLKLLQAYKNVFPIGEPPLFYYRGWFEWLNGKQTQAVQWWKRGLESARKFRMKYEEGLCHLRLGEALSSKEHLEEAIRIFAEMDAIPMLRLARELADRR